MREHAIRLSLIVPARNEELYLPRLMDSVAVARDRYLYGPEAVEVIVADNISTDGTPACAADRRCRVTEVSERKIAAVRNGGAAVAGGRLLAFVDADARIHPDTFNAIDQAMARGDVVAGATGVRLERWSVGIACTYALLVPWVWLLRMDTGVVFCSRDDFDQIGGYDERRYFGEDVQFLWDLKRLGRKRHQRLVRLRSVKAISSTRKFDEHGDWHYFRLIPRLLPLMLRAPEASDNLAQGYWYGDDRA